LLLYVFWWHVGFVLLFRSNGDTIEASLYLMYVKRFMFGPGLEMVGAIQLFAIFSTAVTLAVYLIAGRLRAKAAKTRLRQSV
jgi:hypothetical protein